jgi:hypothetical protein
MPIDFRIKFENGVLTITPNTGPRPQPAHQQTGGSGVATFSKRVGVKSEAGTGGSGTEAHPSPGSGSGGPDSGGLGSGRVVVIGPVVCFDSGSEPGAGGSGTEAHPSPGSGSGGPDSGGPGPGVVVIGPIVLCGQHTKQNAKGTDEPLPLQRSATVKPSTASAAFEMQPQEEGNWCWAAVTVSVDRYFAATSLNVAQCELAGQVFGAGVCGHEENFNEPRTLQKGLRIVGNLNEPPIGGPVDFDTLRKEITADRPVCARIAWDGGGAHFVAIDGCTQFNSGEQQLHVQDPKYGPSFVSYGEMVSGYRYEGEWTDTFLLKG